MIRKSLIFVLVLTLLFTVTAFGKYKSEYKLSLVVGPNSPWGMAGKKFADLVKERTEGRINIKVYFGGQLFAGKQTNEFLLLRKGVADFAIGSTINWSSQVKELNLFSMPFIFKGFKELDAVTNGFPGEMIKKRLKKLGVISIGTWGENGFRQLTNSKREIRNPSDLKDLKIRVVGSPIFLDIFRALGANPLNMNWGDAQTAFRQGVVDGQENPINIVIIPYKIYEFHKYITIWNYAIDPLILGVNKRSWGTFSEKDRKILEETAKEVMDWERAMARVGLDDGSALKYLQSIGQKVEITQPYKYLEEHGMKVTFLTDEERAMFKKATRDVYNKWREKIGADLVFAAEQEIKKVK